MEKREDAGLECSSVHFLMFRSCEWSCDIEAVLTVSLLVFRTDSCRSTREERNEVNHRGHHSQSCAATPSPESGHWHLAPYYPRSPSAQHPWCASSEPTQTSRGCDTCHRLASRMDGARHSTGLVPLELWVAMAKQCDFSSLWMNSPTWSAEGRFLSVWLPVDPGRILNDVCRHRHISRFLFVSPSCNCAGWSEIWS